MRTLLLPLLFFLIACKSKPADKKNENTDYLLSLEGIGPVKTGMSQADLEKLIGNKIPLTNPQDTVSGSWEDSALIQYKDAPLHLGFVRTYVEEDSFYMRVTGIKTSSPLCKTESGIGIGSGKQQIIDAYDNYMIIMIPDYEDTTYTTRSKSRLSIMVREDREGYEITFYLKDNKVYAMAAGTYYDDEE